MTGLPGWMRAALVATGVMNCLVALALLPAADLVFGSLFVAWLVADARTRPTR